MADKTLTVNGQPFTFNRDRFAGVRTMTVSEPPLSDSTVRLQITVSGHADMSGVYERTSTSSNRYNQVNGSGFLEIFEIADGAVSWQLIDGSDNNPNTTVIVNGETNTLPWQGLSEFASQGITLSHVTETVTVDRTASVIDSDRAGESRPLLSKVVGGAAAAYSLRDLNEKGGHSKVVDVRRSGDNVTKTFTAIDLVNGNLLAHVNEDVVTEQSDFTSGVDGYVRDSHGTISREASFEGKSDVLKYTHTGGRFGLRKTTVSLDRTSSYTISFEYYADAIFSGEFWGNEAAFANSPTISSNTPTVVSGAWTSVTLNVPSGRTSGTTILRPRIQKAPIGGSSTDAKYGTTTNGSVRIKNIVVTQLTGSGFVETWYDQSGNNNHAVQATIGNQPQIVSNGDLIKGSNGKPEISFIGANQNLLRTTSPISFSDVLFTFRRTTSGTQGLLAEISTNSSPYTYIHHSNATFSFDGNSGANPTANLGFDGQFYANQSGDKGGIVTVAQHLAYINYPNNRLGEISDIGRLYNGVSLYGTFTASELIFYASSQLANRPALEANINNQYSIYS